jgi:hypothetical protein
MYSLCTATHLGSLPVGLLAILLRAVGGVTVGSMAFSGMTICRPSGIAGGHMV